MKFVTADKTFTPAGLVDSTPYTIMFGPDKCGLTNKVHLILRHENQKTKKIEEKHLKDTAMVIDDSHSHAYTAILFPNNNTYQVLIDGHINKQGSLFEDFDPSFVPDKEIDDPKDTKPSSWVDEATIPDPAAKKPEDWDEDAPEFIPDENAAKPEGWLDDEPEEIDDPEASKPEDWDDEEDGDWEPNRITNPKCKSAPGCGEWTRPNRPNPDFKGKWSAPLIDNPKYKGEWAPRKIANPDFHNDTAPLSHIGSIGGVAVEIWTMDDNYYFDNVVVSNDPAEAATIRDETWKPKYTYEVKEQAKKDAEEEKKTAAEMKKMSGGFFGVVKARVAGLVESILDFPALAPITSKIPYNVRAGLIGNPMAIIAAVAALVALVLTPKIMQATQKQAEAVKVGQAKKNDDKNPAAAAAAKEEIEEDDGDEDASPTRAARRRVRRD
jgi:calnexin